MTKEWKLYIKEQPKTVGVYEWRIQSKAVPGMVLIVAAHMRERGAGYERVLSPIFDYWDGYRLHVLSPVEWRPADAHLDLKWHEQTIISVEGFEPCECIYCGKTPKIEASKRSSGGVTIGPKPWDLNSWRFVCCQWGSTPSLGDPREIERIRRAAIAKARGETK